MMEVETMYTAKATSTGGRDGKVVSPDGMINLQLKRPKEMGGDGGQATNPEQLFAAGYSACFNSALELVMKKNKVDAPGSEVTANISIGKETDGGFKLAARLDVKIEGVDKETAKKASRRGTSSVSLLQSDPRKH